MIYPYGPFPAGDGKTVILGLQNDREWLVFCDKVLGRPELARDERFADNPKRSAAREELRALIVEHFAAFTADQVADQLETAGIANARMRTMQEVWEHPQLSARQRWRQIDTPAGPMPALLPPGNWPQDPRMDAVPALGQHTDAILAELGLDAAAIEALRAQQAI